MSFLANGETSGPVNNTLHATALNLLQSSGYAALRRLRCEIRETDVIVTGVVPSFYLKQMAQTLILRLDGIHTVRNLVEVRPSDCFQQATDTDATSSLAERTLA
jgi:hypothetical protein